MNYPGFTNEDIATGAGYSEDTGDVFVFGTSHESRSLTTTRPRLHFCDLIVQRQQRDCSFVGNILFSDKAAFHLNGLSTYTTPSSTPSKIPVPLPSNRSRRRQCRAGKWLRRIIK